MFSAFILSKKLLIKTTIVLFIWSLISTILLQFFTKIISTQTLFHQKSPNYSHQNKYHRLIDSFDHPNIFQKKLNLDNSIKLSQTKIISSMIEESKLPLSYWNRIRLVQRQQMFQEIKQTNSRNDTFWSQLKKDKSKQNIFKKIKNESKTSSNCSSKIQFPNLLHLKYNNIYWQNFQVQDHYFSKTEATIHASNQQSNRRTQFYLYSAYYDDRELVGSKAKVRIIAMIDKLLPPKVHCQFWCSRNGSNQTIVKSSKAWYFHGWKQNWGKWSDQVLHPYLISCLLPEDPCVFGSVSSKENFDKDIKNEFQEKEIPFAVSLVLNPCDQPLNILKISNSRSKIKRQFCVCVKPLDFMHQDISARLIEWLELVKILGASKVFFYEFQVHKNVTKVLDYYKDLDLIEVTKISLPGNQPNEPFMRHLYLNDMFVEKRLNELIPLNDCFYKSIYSYDYVVLLDIDEVIMPIMDKNWSEMVENARIKSITLNNFEPASYVFKNAYFLDENIEKSGNKIGENKDEEEQNSVQISNRNMTITLNDIPSYMHILTHLTRSGNHSKFPYNVKCFHDTKKVEFVHNHLPMACLRGFSGSPLFDLFQTKCNLFTLDVNQAYLAHYKKDCSRSQDSACRTDLESQDKNIRDKSVLRFKKQLIQNTNNVLKKLAFLDSFSMEI